MRDAGAQPLAEPQGSDQALKAILEDPRLSQMSKHAYVQRLKVASAGMQMPASRLILAPQTALAWIERRYKELATRRNMVTACLAALRRMPARGGSLLQIHKRALGTWLKASKALEDLQQARLKENQPSDRQRRAYVPFQDVILAREVLPRGSPERLMMCMYSMIAPVRCDYNRVLLVQCAKSAAELSDEQVQQIRESNFICIPGDAQQPAILVLRAYKTSKQYGVWRRLLPMDLTAEIRRSLRARPRKWLFQTEKGNPYTAKAFSSWCCGVLMKCFRKPVTLTILRHSYLNSLDFNRLRISDRESIAAAMQHSVATQATYRWVPKGRSASY